MILTFEIVSENEAAFFGSVSVEIYIDFQITELLLLDNGFLGDVNRGLLLGVWVQIKSVQVVVVGVQTVVSSSNTIWVEQGNDFELVLLEEKTGLLRF